MQKLFFFTALFFFINSNATALKEIKLKYFEKGHTFMSADSYRHMVEKAMKDLNNVYDFEDWLSALNENGHSIVLEGEDCWAVKKGLSTGKHTSVPYIENIQEAKFSRGSTKLFWKNCMEQLDYSSGEFLQKRIINEIENGVSWPCFSSKYSPRGRGISKIKKNDINEKLCPLMPPEKYFF